MIVDGRLQQTSNLSLCPSHPIVHPLNPNSTATPRPLSRGKTAPSQALASLFTRLARTASTARGAAPRSLHLTLLVWLQGACLGFLEFAMHGCPDALSLLAAACSAASGVGGVGVGGGSLLLPPAPINPQHRCTATLPHATETRCFAAKDCKVGDDSGRVGWGKNMKKIIDATNDRNNRDFSFRWTAAGNGREGPISSWNSKTCNNCFNASAATGYFGPLIWASKW